MSSVSIMNKKRYHILCKDHNMPIFHKDWWLNAVCGEDGWDVMLYEQQGKIIASMPYSIKSSFLFTRIEQPIFTQKLGPHMVSKESIKGSKLISLEKKVFSYFIEQMPKFSLFQQNFTTSITNWLPFYWAGFKQTTRYSYILKDLSDFDRIYDNFDRSKKKHIKKSLETITIKHDVDVKEFYNNHVLTLSQNSKQISYSFEILKKIYDNAIKNSSGQIIGAYDSNNNLHAALFVVWDNETAYNLISTIDINYRNSGASSLIVFEAIKSVAKYTKSFDFCGSMNEHIESSIRKFGGNQVFYFTVQKVDSLALRMKGFIKTELKTAVKLFRK